MDSWNEERVVTDEWLKNLKPGDEVAISTGHGHSFAKVRRTTPTQILVGETLRYRRSDGDRVGAGVWSRENLVRPTDELKAQIRERVRLNRAQNKCDDLTRGKLSKYTVEQLEAVIAILEPKPDQQS